MSHQWVDRRPRIRCAAAAASLALAVVACDVRDSGGDESSVAGEPGAAGGAVAGSPGRGIDAEFERVAERLEASENRYFGRGQIARLAAEAEKSSLPVEAEVNVLLQLAWHRLRLGETEAAIGTASDAFAVVEDAGGKPSPSMLRLRALAFLRQAELENCVARHNRDCCIFPLAGDGVHSNRGPATAAHRALLDLLALEPGNLEAAWLLNLTAMAIGEWPAAVPERYRVPARVFSGGDSGTPRFVDVAGELGAAPLDLAGGAVLEDFDGDGRLDIVTSTYDPRGWCKFFRQEPTGKFVDLSDSSGLARQGGCALNCLAGDYDNDGDPDLLVLRGAWLREDGRIRNSLLRNNGDRTFTDVTREAGLAEPPMPTQAATWGDFDNDGDLDLFVGNESRRELDGDAGNGFPSQLFRNNGDGTFTDVARSAGVTNDRYCKGVTAGDYDDDGDLDLYVSNLGANRLYRNEGGLVFRDVAAEAGVAEPVEQSFASWFFDFDNDTDLDLFVAGYQSSNADVAADVFGLPHQGTPPRLYRNDGGGRFDDVTDESGLNHAWLPMGANFGDLDNDGFLDIYLATGRPDFAALMPNVMLRNDGGRRFVDVTLPGGFGHLQKGHGVAFGDYDGDGDQDIYHQLGGFFPSDQFHNALFENPGGGGTSVTIKLVGTTSNRQGAGARVTVTTEARSGGVQRLHRAAGSVSSFGGSPSRLEIGLGDATAIREIAIRWPASDTVQTITGVAPGARIKVIEGTPGFAALAPAGE